MTTQNWRGNAVAIEDEWTLTAANTWAGADTAVATINGKDLSVVIGTGTTTTGVATSVKEAWELTSGTAVATDTTAVVSPRGGGKGGKMPEFSELTATVASAVATVRGNTAGVPHTVSASETTAGDGTLTANNSVAATGPSFWSNSDNWTSAVPVNSDTVNIDGTALVDITYGLAQSGVTVTNLNITGGLRNTVKIGLPERNANGYDEYRATELAIGATNVEIDCNSGRIKLNLGSVQTAIVVRRTGTSSETGFAACQLRGTHASNTAEVLGGDVSFAATGGQTATLATLTQAGGTVLCGSGCTLTTISKTGGTLTTNSAATTVTNNGGTITLNAGAHTTINMNKGTLNYNSSGTITNLNCLATGEKPFIDFDGDTTAVTVTNCTITAGTRIRDSAQRVAWTNGIDLYGCSIEDVTLELGRHLTITPTGI